MKRKRHSPVQVRQTAQEAKDAACPRGNEAFAWRRFFFQGERTDLAKIKRALP